jgi:hypothetical protein
METTSSPSTMRRDLHMKLVPCRRVRCKVIAELDAVERWSWSGRRNTVGDCETCSESQLSVVYLDMSMRSGTAKQNQSS